MCKEPSRLPPRKKQEVAHPPSETVDDGTTPDPQVVWSCGPKHKPSQAEGQAAGTVHPLTEFQQAPTSLGPREDPTCEHPVATWTNQQSPFRTETRPRRQHHRPTTEALTCPTHSTASQHHKLPPGYPNSFRGFSDGFGTLRRISAANAKQRRFTTQ